MRLFLFAFALFTVACGTPAETANTTSERMTDFHNNREITPFIYYSELLSRYPGIRVVDNHITIRGKYPLYVVNGLVVNGLSGAHSHIMGERITRIDVLTPVQSAAYGKRGGNGVIRFWTSSDRTPEVVKDNI